MASGAEETREARAGSSTVIADTTSGAVTTSLITVSVKRIRPRWAFLQVAGRTTVAGITQTANVFHVVPRGGVGTPRLGGKVLLRPAGALIVTVVGADGTLTSNTIVPWVADTLTRLAITVTLVGALHPRMQVVLVDNFTNPSKVLRTSALGAIRTSPFSFAVKAQITVAVIVQLTSTVTRARVLTKTTLSVTSLIPGNLSPTLSHKRWSRRWQRGRLTRWRRWLGGRFTTGLARWLTRRGIGRNRSRCNCCTIRYSCHKGRYKYSKHHFVKNIYESM